MDYNDAKLSANGLTSPQLFSFAGIRLINQNAADNLTHNQSLHEHCFFLDLDGTLLDLALTPDAVRIEDGLQSALQTIATRTDGALAIISGRSIDFIDTLLPGHGFAVAGLHGAQIRHGPTDNFAAANASSDFSQALEITRQAASLIADIVFEDKGQAFAVHYRQAPHQEPLVRHLMSDAARIAGANYVLQEGKFVVELKPSASNKGTAVEMLMAQQPFLGKRPVAAGDDHTDEAMFIAVNQMNGVSMRIGSSPPGLKTNAILEAESPKIFRNWIRKLAE